MSFHCGYRFFQCESCGRKWKEKSRDAETQSCSICPEGECDGWKTGGVYPSGFEKHPEWKIDKFGNLLVPNLYIGAEEWE